MLHIKLPKKRVAHALMAVADAHEAKAAAIMVPCSISSQARTKHWLRAKVASLRVLADTAKHSTGDVFVSVDLWNEIKDHYDG